MHNQKMIALALCTGGLLAGAGCEALIGIEDTRIEADSGVQADSAVVEARTLRIVAAGIMDPVSVELRTTGAEEILSVTGDGEFAFGTELAEGDSYTVTFVSAPGECGMSGEVGVVQGGDPEIVLLCWLLDDVALTSARVPDLGFSATQPEYRAEVSLMQENVSVIASAIRADIDIEIAGRPAASGEPSELVPLPLGETVIPVIARHAPSGAQVRYDITVDRAGGLVQAAYAKTSNSRAGDEFGFSVALSERGDLLAVGAISEDSGATGVDGDQADSSAGNSGAVYVFRRSGASWTQEAYLKASNTDGGDRFGWSVALSEDGDTLAVGAIYEDSGATGVDGDQADNSAGSSGAVYVYRRSGASWAQQAYLKASNTGAGDGFGWSVALSGSGDTLAVGAGGEESGATGVDGDQADNSAHWSGAVYVFQRSGASWAQQAYLKASNTNYYDRFGYRVALSESGDTLATSAIYEDSGATSVDGNQADNSANWSGAAYVFQRSGATWAQQAYLKASNTDAVDYFGFGVALSKSGDTLAVSAHEECSVATGVDGNQADNSAADSGAVYVYGRSGATWTQDAYLKASNTGAGDRFGSSLALSGSGDTLAVGAYGEASVATGVDGNQADNSASWSGAAYVFRRSGATWAQDAYVKASNTGAGDYFGIDVALSGSGDTLVVGAHYEDSSTLGMNGDEADNSAEDSGAVYLFH